MKDFLNCFLGHLHDGDITNVIDTVRYCTFFACQCNGCSIVIGIRNMWYEKEKYGVATDRNKCFTERLNELDEELYNVSHRRDWSRSSNWHCGNCVAFRYQYDVGSRHGHLMRYRMELDERITAYSKDAMKRYSSGQTKCLSYDDQLSEYKLMLKAINECDNFENKGLSSFQTCLLFQTLAITGILPLQCYEFAEVDIDKGPYSLIRSVFNTEIQQKIKDTKKKRKAATIEHRDKEVSGSSSPLTVIREINCKFLNIKKSLSGKGKNQMAIPGITHEFLENVLCKISGYLKPSLFPSDSDKGNSASANAARSSIVHALLSEKNQATLHTIMNGITNWNTCKKWDYHFHDNGMGKICNLFRVRPTSKNSGPVLEVRSSTSSETLQFCVEYIGTNSNVDISGLNTVFVLLYK